MALTDTPHITPIKFTEDLGVVQVVSPLLPGLTLYVHLSAVVLNGVRRQTLFAAASENGIEYDHIIECYPKDFPDCGSALQTYLVLQEFQTELIDPLVSTILKKRAEIAAWASRA
jgi:hypothetical protein